MLRAKNMHLIEFYYTKNSRKSIWMSNDCSITFYTSKVKLGLNSEDLGAKKGPENSIFWCLNNNLTTRVWISFKLYHKVQFHQRKAGINFGGLIQFRIRDLKKVFFWCLDHYFSKNELVWNYTTICHSPTGSLVLILQVLTGTI